MIETAVILALAVPGVLLTWYAFQLENSAEGIRLLFASVGILFLIGTAFTGYMFALNGASTADLFDEVQSIANITGEDGRSTDAFGIRVAKNTNNLLNLPAHHPYSRERLRVNIDGEFKNLQYNSYPEYTKHVDFHELAPDSGGNVTLESAESPPYIVSYELWYSWAFNVNRTLETGDVIRIGAFTAENGYFLKMNSTSGVDEAYMMVRRNGSNTKAIRTSLTTPVTESTRFELRSNWYNVGEQTWIQTSTDLGSDNVQENELIGYTAPEGDRLEGPEIPQLPVRFQVERGAGNTPISLNAGSANIMVAGETNAVRRSKTDYFTETVSQAGEWEPVAAIRINDDAEYIRGELSSVDLAKTSASTDFFTTAQSHDPDLVLSGTGQSVSTDGTGWHPPMPLSSSNSIVQITKNVSQAPNSTGTPVTSTANPGGFQLGWGSLYSTGNKGSADASAQQDLKRPLYGSDVVVFWVKAEDEGNPTIPADVTIEYVVEEDW